MVRLDIVIPVYNEEALLPELTTRLNTVLGTLEGVQSVVTLVDDGSHDGSVAWLRTYTTQNPTFRLVELSRNFGHQAAISAGIAAADPNADALIVMDGDLQDPPELIPDLVAAWREGADVVQAVRRSRSERGLRGLGFSLFHALLHRLTDLPSGGNTGVFALLSRPAATALRSLPERNRFLPGLRAWIGFTQHDVLFDRPSRPGGPPKQSLRRLARYAMDAFFGFSYKPLRLMTGFGLVVSTLGFLLATVFILRRLLSYEIADTGFTTLVALILFLGGIQLLCFGVLGEYIARVYDEAKGRPLFVVRPPQHAAPKPDDSPRNPDA